MEKENPPRYSEIILNVPDLLSVPPTEQTEPAGNRESDARSDVNRNQHFPNSPTFPVSCSATTLNGIEAHSVPITEQSGYSDIINEQSNENRNRHFPNSPTFPASRNTATDCVNVEVETNYTRPVYPASAQQVTFNQPLFGHIVGVCPNCRVGYLQEKFTCFGWCCCLFCFPLGLICFFTMKEKVCYYCGTKIKDC